MLFAIIILLIILVILMFGVFTVLCDIGVDISNCYKFIRKENYNYLLKDLNKKGEKNRNKNGKFRYKK